MLDSLRQYASGWVAQLFLVLLVVSFAVWGVSGVFSGFGANTIATVGKTEVSVREFQRRYDLATSNLSRQLGQQITREQAAQFGVPDQVLSTLITEATLDHAAGQLGLGISNQTLARRIAEDPTLVAPNGAFDRSYLSQIIASQRMTEDEFIVDRRRQYVRDQLAEAFGGGLATPDAYMRAIHQYRAEQRNASYVVVAAPPRSDIAAPGETELAAFFEVHKADWRAPEYRTIRYFTLSPSEIARSEDVTDDDARKRYDGQIARFSTPEMRQVEQIVFTDRAEAAAAAAALTAGKTFGELVAERNLKPADIDLGLITRDKIVDPAIADAAFQLAQGAVSAIVDGRFGPAIVRVQKIEAGVVKTFDEVMGDLKAEIATAQAADTITALHDTIEDARAGGATLTEAAATYDLTMATVPAIDASGKDPDGNAVEALPGGELLQAAFATEVGFENDPVEPDNVSYVWYEVTALTEARDRTLAEVHDKVVTAWQDAERQNRMIAEADEVKGRLDNGGDLAAIAAALSLTVETADVTRSNEPSGDLSAAAISAAFAGPKGHTAVATGAAAMSRVVLLVNAAETPPYVSGAPELAQAKQQFDSQIINDLLGLYVVRLQGQTDVLLNQAALQLALGVVSN